MTDPDQRAKGDAQEMQELRHAVWALGLDWPSWERWWHTTHQNAFESHFSVVSWVTHHLTLLTAPRAGLASSPWPPDMPIPRLPWVEARVAEGASHGAAVIQWVEDGLGSVPASPFTQTGDLPPHLPAHADVNYLEVSRALARQQASPASPDRPARLFHGCPDWELGDRLTDDSVPRTQPLWTNLAAAVKDVAERGNGLCSVVLVFAHPVQGWDVAEPGEQTTLDSWGGMVGARRPLPGETRPLNRSLVDVEFRTLQGQPRAWVRKTRAWDSLLRYLESVLIISWRQQ